MSSFQIVSIGATLMVPKEKMSIPVIAIGASLGGPKALKRVLCEFPIDFPCGIVIVQHINEEFVLGLVSWLDKTVSIRVKEAKVGDKIESGVAFIAPYDFQMTVVNGEEIRLRKSSFVGGYRPSVDVLFSSVSKLYSVNSIGILLSGMGSDGAMGLSEMRKNGSKTIAQDKETSGFFGMPKVAIDMGAAEEILPIDEIGKFVSSIIGN